MTLEFEFMSCLQHHVRTRDNEGEVVLQRKMTGERGREIKRTISAELFSGWRIKS